MFTKRAMSIVLVASAVMLAIGIGLRFAGNARALPSIQAGVTIPYTGHLTDESGQTIIDGAYDFTFALYTVETGGEPLWTEVQEDVLVQGGAFATLLGSATPLPQETPNGSVRWLEVAVRGPGETGFTLLSPRQELSADLTMAPASPSAGPACPHDHLGEEWTGTFADYGLKINNLGYGAALIGSASDVGVYGESSAGHGSGVSGRNDQDNGKGVEGFNSGSGTGVYGHSTTGTGVYGHSTTGTGVEGYSMSGSAIVARGSGIIISIADSILYLSPHDMVAREADPSVVSITPLDNGGVRVRNLAGAPPSKNRYLSIPVSTLGTLFGAPLYVKSIEVCYKAPAAATFIDVTGVYKNSGSDTGWSTYIEDTTNLDSVTYTCHPASATTPRQAINNSTWVQFNMVFANSGSGWDIYIYTVKLTLTESQN